MKAGLWKRVENPKDSAINEPSAFSIWEFEPHGPEA